MRGEKRRRRSALLTRAVGREACSPGREELVLIQFVCRCVQHHQEKKSGPQRHIVLSTPRIEVNVKKTSPARCNESRKNRGEKKKKRKKRRSKSFFSVAPEQDRCELVQVGSPAASLRWAPRCPFDLHDRSHRCQVCTGFIWERWTLRVRREDQSEPGNSRP